MLKSHLDKAGVSYFEKTISLLGPWSFDPNPQQALNSSTMLRALTLFAFISCCFLLGCDDDDDGDNGNRTPLTYDPATTIYGTLGYAPEDVWEVVIDPISGQVDSISGTKQFMPLSLPLGPRFFQAFNPDRRFFVDLSQDLRVQNLETFAYETFSDGTPNGLVNPQFITQGRSDNELIILDTDQSLWLANTVDFTLSKWIDDLTPQGRRALYAFQVGENEILRIFAGSCANCPEASTMDVIDSDLVSVLAAGDLSETGFGFVRHPASNDFYFLSQSNQTRGFRLGVLSWDGSSITERIISTEDLEINNLSGQQQTIHTASNTFIAVSPSGTLEAPENILYRIDLTTGELVGEVSLQTDGQLFKISGE